MHDLILQIRDYHQRSKHSFNRYAPGPGYLDWATQPDPFRRWSGAPRIELPLGAAEIPTGYADLFQPGAVASRPLDLAGVGRLLELSFGLSAWKQAGGSRWALRCHPSSGNLHPTEAYVVAGGLADLADGVYHYQSESHLLEQRCLAPLPLPGVLVGLSSVHWREAWKYGERAFRYCQHDLGHALGALRYATASLGWGVRLLETWSDADIAALLGLDRVEDFADAEPEAPDLICAIQPTTSPLAADILPASLLQATRAGRWQGQANRLSLHHRHQWPLIDQVAQAAAKPATSATPRPISSLPPLLPLSQTAGAAALIQQRRSAQAFDGVGTLTTQAFYRILDATLPRSTLPPFDSWPWPPRVHLLLFVHRVIGLEPGLYLLGRSDGLAESARGMLRADWEWAPVETPLPRPLFRLARGDARELAQTLACHQEIAADSALSLAMLAEFDTALEEGPWVYRRLFWESGLIGQVLYLEAEAAGSRGTGIGCFFDDEVHKLLGLEDKRLQSLYHFTLGTPLIDPRLQTLPPYAHLPAHRFTPGAGKPGLGQRPVEPISRSPSENNDHSSEILFSK